MYFKTPNLNRFGEKREIKIWHKDEGISFTHFCLNAYSTLIHLCGTAVPSHGRHISRFNNSTKEGNEETLLIFYLLKILSTGDGF